MKSQSVFLAVVGLKQLLCWCQSQALCPHYTIEWISSLRIYQCGLGRWLTWYGAAIQAQRSEVASQHPQGSWAEEHTSVRPFEGRQQDVRSSLPSQSCQTAAFCSVRDPVSKTSVESWGGQLIPAWGHLHMCAHTWAYFHTRNIPFNNIQLKIFECLASWVLYKLWILTLCWMWSWWSSFPILWAAVLSYWWCPLFYWSLSASWGSCINCWSQCLPTWCTVQEAVYNWSHLQDVLG